MKFLSSLSISEIHPSLFKPLIIKVFTVLYGSVQCIWTQWNRRRLKFDIFDRTLRSCDVAMDIRSQLRDSSCTPHTGGMCQTVCRHIRTSTPSWPTRKSSSSRTFKMPKKSDTAKLTEGVIFKIWFLLLYKVIISCIMIEMLCFGALFVFWLLSLSGNRDWWDRECWG